MSTEYGIRVFTDIDHTIMIRAEYRVVKIDKRSLYSVAVTNFTETSMNKNLYTLTSKSMWLVAADMRIYIGTRREDQ